MRILDRYLIREFVVPLVYCLLAFLLIYIIYDLSAHLDNYIEAKIPFSVLVEYYLTQLPLVMVNVIPLSILLAIVYSLGALSRHNEITAMRANGISVYRIMFPFFLLGTLFTAILFYLNENFAPEAYARSEKLIGEYEQGGEEGESSVLAFFNPLGQRAWAAHWEPGSNTLTNVTVRNFLKGRVVEKVTAEEARFVKEGYNGVEWWFLNGKVQSYDNAGRPRGEGVPFKKRRFPYNERPDDFLSSQKDSMSMNYMELSNNMALYPKDSDIYRRKLVDLYYKLAFPFVGITIVLIAVPLAIRVSHGGAAGSVGLSIALGISYYALGMVSLSMGRGGWLPPFIASWLPNILFSAVGIRLIYRSR
jgi:lipopolysaccharide export system permease protein